MNTYLYPHAALSPKRVDGQRTYDVGIGIYNHSPNEMGIEIILQTDGKRLPTKMFTVQPYTTLLSMLSTLVSEPKEDVSYQIFIPNQIFIFPIAYQFQTDENGNRQMETLTAYDVELTLGEL